MEEQNLPENILDIDTKSVKCFLCNKIFVTGDESFLLFNDRIQSDGSSECPLAQVLSSALSIEVVESSAHSSLLCSACNDVVLEYENIERRLFEIRMRIVTAYSNTTLRFMNSEDIKKELNIITEEQTLDDPNQMIAEVDDNSNELTEEVVEEKMNLASNVFDSFQMIGTSTELHEDIKLFTVDSNLNFDDSKDEGTIVYKELSNDDNSTISEGQHIVTIGNDDLLDSTTERNSLENIIFSSEMHDGETSSIVVEESNEIYSCSICEDSNHFLDIKSFSDHMQTEHEIQIYPCDFCSNVFQRKEDLNDHITRDHCEPETVHFECEICSTSFKSYNHFRAHKRTHTTGNKFECQKCEKKHNCKASLDEHMNVHFGLRPFHCEQCPKKFASKYSLHIHLKIHGKRERPHKCEECGKSFLTIQNLQHHKKTHSEKLFVCEVCQKSFATQHNLNAHNVVHSGKRPFACRTCGKTFARRAEVIDHERIHTGDRPFKCDLCEMAFTQRSNLTVHKKTTHLNEKQHKCDICNRSFKRRRLLDYHTQAVHTGERPYKCEICSSSFVYPEHYKKHLRIHTGLKPFACEVCGKQFSSRDNRNAHRFVHSDKKPYECVECGTGFMRKPLLFAHMKHMRHFNDTIIVNQPQISGGKMETQTFTVQSEEIYGSFQEFIVPDCGEEDLNKGEEEVEVSESVSLEKILPKSQSTISSEPEIKSEIDDVKYLQFDDFDAGNHQTLSWVDLAGDKD